MDGDQAALRGLRLADLHPAGEHHREAMADLPNPAQCLTCLIAADFAKSTETLDLSHVKDRKDLFPAGFVDRRSCDGHVLTLGRPPGAIPRIEAIGDGTQDGLEWLRFRSPVRGGVVAWLVRDVRAQEHLGLRPPPRPLGQTGS
jgi:hypothetical protein